MATSGYTEDPVYVSLDQKFDKALADMKPYVLKLPHKTGTVHYITSLYSLL